MKQQLLEPLLRMANLYLAHFKKWCSYLNTHNKIFFIQVDLLIYNYIIQDSQINHYPSNIYVFLGSAIFNIDIEKQQIFQYLYSILIDVAQSLNLISIHTSYQAQSLKRRFTISKLSSQGAKTFRDVWIIQPESETEKGSAG
jgi:hypothetical protein